MLICHEAEHDALIAELNRGSFEKSLSIYEKGQSDFSMIICDVDSFKAVNDTYGHAVSDEILKKWLCYCKKNPQYRLCLPHRR